MDHSAAGVADITSGKQEVEPPIVVVIGPARYAVHSAGHAGWGGVVENAPSVVVVQPGHVVRAVVVGDEQQVEPSIVIVIAPGRASLADARPVRAGGVMQIAPAR